MSEYEEILLHGSRNGDLTLVSELLAAADDGRIQSLDINCKGSQKSNFGWTPLHLACYFGHTQVVQQLLKHKADVNVMNSAGDTPLHKASFTGREHIVLILLQHNADVFVTNGEGRTSKDLALAKDIRKLIDGVEKTEMLKKEQQLLTAAKDGDAEILNLLLKSTSPPNINCSDIQGNTALHCASYRDRKEVAVILLQNGIDTTLTNFTGQTALDLARTTQMKQLLDVQPIKFVQKSVNRFEGHLLKRSRFVGWRSVWVVLERGVLTYFSNRADATAGVKRKSYKYLDCARITPMEVDPKVFVVHFSDNTVHRLSLPEEPTNPVSRQKWLNAVREHIAYSGHYMNQGRPALHAESDDDVMENVLPLGSIQDAFETALAHQKVLQNQISGLSCLLQVFKSSDSCRQGPFQTLNERLGEITTSSHSMITSLSHCLAVLKQQEGLRLLQLKQEQEKCRVLEDALHVLAKENQELERSLAVSCSPSHRSRSHYTPKFLSANTRSASSSVASVYLSCAKSNSRRSTVKSPRFYDTSDDEFYDLDEDSNSDGASTLAGSPPPEMNQSPTGTISSVGSFVVVDGDMYYKAREHAAKSKKNRFSKHYGRTKLPVPAFTQSDFSIWNILKHSIGKELTKITMPVVFNEPLSFLQRLSEYLEYDYLLKSAAECPDPIDRIQMVGAFAVSGLACNWERLGKPFNPLLGETYELEKPEFRIMSEQVSHHPPVSAFHADSPDWCFHGSIHPKLKFWGKSIEIQPKGIMTVDFPKLKEAYTWTNVNCCIHNIILGKLWIEQYGVMEIVCHGTGLKLVIHFKPAGWFSKDLHRLEGFVIDQSKTKLRYLYGKWTESLSATTVKNYDDYVKTSDRIRRLSLVSSNQDVTPRNSPPLSSNHSSADNSTASSPTIPTNGYDDMSTASELDSETLPASTSGTLTLEIPDSILLWEADPRPDYSKDYFHFTYFAMALNELDPDIQMKLPRTDSRLRPDIRKLEEGLIDEAAMEKNRLEEYQREVRKNRKKAKEAWSPKWFVKATNPYTKEEDWISNENYWQRNFENSDHIF